MTPFATALAKETRALLPLWAACTLAIGVHGLAQSRVTEWAAFLAYVLGSVALGAYTIGEEYTARTFSVLLVQPVGRQLLFLAKLVPLSLMLAALGIFAWLALLGDRLLRPPAEVLILPVIAGLFVAPWITMLTRNPLAGIVFPLGLAGIFFVVIDGITPFVISGDAPAASRLAYLIWSRGMFVVAAVAAVLGWRAFMHYEANEGTDTGIHLPRWFGATGDARVRGPFWPLVRKELRLQQMTIAVVILYVVGATGVYVSFDGPQRNDVFFGVTVLYGLSVALVAGSLASAEERQLGMLAAQRVLPVGHWRQWMVKVATTMAVAVVGGLLVPVIVLSFINPNATLQLFTAAGFGLALGVIATVVTVSLWISSLSISPTRALGPSFAACAALSYVFTSLAVFVFANTGRVYTTNMQWSVAVFVLVLLYFGAVNHNSSERPVRLVVLQVLVAAAILPIGLGPTRLMVLMRQYANFVWS